MKKISIHDMHYLTLHHGANSRLVGSDVLTDFTSLTTNQLLDLQKTLQWCVSWIGNTCRVHAKELTETLGVEYRWDWTSITLYDSKEKFVSWATVWFHVKCIRSWCQIGLVVRQLQHFIWDIGYLVGKKLSRPFILKASLFWSTMSYIFSYSLRSSFQVS